MASANTSVAVLINDITRSMTLFFQIWNTSVFFLGAVGHALSIYVFTRSEFRANACTRYFFASTLAGCGVVYLTIPLRFLQIIFQVDLFKTSRPMCQILSYILPLFRVLASWLIALASIDRFLCSSQSAVLRAWSDPRVALRAILVAILCVAVAHLHMPFYHTIVYPQQTCAMWSNDYRAFYALFNLVVWSWIPTICMLIFGLLTVRHIQLSKKKIVPLNQTQPGRKRTDRQLMQMLFVQSLVYGATTTAWSIGQLYISITNNMWAKTTLERVNDEYMSNILNSIANVGPCMSFYLFALSSGLFRRELLKLFQLYRAKSRTTAIPLTQVTNPSITVGRDKRF